MTIETAGRAGARQCRHVTLILTMGLAALLAACQSSERQKQVTAGTVMGAGLGVFGGPIGVTVGAGLGAAAGAIMPEGALEEPQASELSK